MTQDTEIQSEFNKLMAAQALADVQMALMAQTNLTTQALLQPGSVDAQTVEKANERVLRSIDNLKPSTPKLP